MDIAVTVVLVCGVYSSGRLGFGLVVPFVHREMAVIFNQLGFFLRTPLLQYKDCDGMNP